MLLLSSIHYSSFIALLLISVLANLTSDSLIFLFSNKILEKIELQRFKNFRKYERIMSRTLKRTRNPEKLIFISKLIYGTRVVTVILLGRYKLVKFRKFVLYDTLALAMIAFIVLGVGWHFGYVVANYVNNIFIYFAIILLFLFIIKKCTEKKFVQWFLRSEKKKE